jgi:tripeptide aminopeptidase
MADLISQILDLAVEIQQISAPTFHEQARAEFVRHCFTEEGLEEVEMDSLGNVYARLPGSSSKKPLVVSAHLDTVFPKNVDLRVEREPGSLAKTGTTARILAPGIGDNSLGVAALFGLVWILRQRGLALPGDCWLVANVCEEGLGDLRGMQSLVARFGHSPLAYLVLEGMALGHIYHRGLGVCRYRISIHASGGHSWTDYGQPSAIHELASLSARLTALQLPRTPRTTLNIGIISGGSSVNTIAAEAMLELDLRSESADALQDLVGQVEQLVQAARKPGVEVEAELIGQRPSGEIQEDHPLVRLAQDCLREVGIQPQLNIGSTDANLPLSLGYPAITIGLTSGGRAHTVREFINVDPLEKGLEQLLRLVRQVWDRF